MELIEYAPPRPRPMALAFGPQIPLPFPTLPIRLALARATTDVAPDVQVLLQHLSHTTLETPLSLLDTVVQHPDELVRLTAVQNWSDLLTFVRMHTENDRAGTALRSRGEQAAATLVATALAEAAQERVLWTPLLDALATSEVWPDDQALESADGVPLPPPREVAAPLATVVPTGTVPEITHLLRFVQASRVREQLIQHAPGWDDRLLGATFTWAGGHRALIAREDITSSAAERIWHLALDRNERLQRTSIARDARNPGDDIPDRDLWKTARALLARFGAMPDSVVTRCNTAIAAASAALAAKGTPRGEFSCTALRLLALHPLIDPAVSGPLLSKHSDETTLGRLLCNPAVTPALRQRFWDRIGSEYRISVRTALAQRRLPEAVLLECVPRCTSSDIAVRILQHQNATVAVGRAVMEHHYEWDSVRDTLAADLRFRSDPVIRARLLRCRVSTVLLPLLAEATPEEFAAVWPRLVQVEPEVAVSFLERGVLPPGCQVPSASLAGLLIPAKSGAAGLVDRVITIMDRVTTPDELRPVVPLKTHRRV